MNKYGVLFLIILFTNQVRAQFSITPSDSVSLYDVATPNLDAFVSAYCTNTSPTNIIIEWRFIYYTGAMGWDLAFCDKENCYSADTLVKEFELAPQEVGDMKYTISHNCKPGSGEARVDLWIKGDSANTSRSIKYTAQIDIDNACTVNVTDRSLTRLSIYPNPAKDLITISGLKTNGGEQLCIFDLSGRLILDNQIRSSQVDISTLHSGYYLLRVYESGKAIAQGSFMK
jgi:hypothetical protein